MAGAKEREREMWGGAPWERVASTMAAIHDRLTAALVPRPGDRWLDVATGTGAVAIRAAREGASVTGLDLAPPLIETAKRLAAEQGLAIGFEVGDAEALPYPDASFDVVSSAHGVVFARDHAAVARELARVCRPGGRLGLTAWRTGEAGDAFHELIARFAPPRPAGPPPGSWGEQAHARAARRLIQAGNRPRGVGADGRFRGGDLAAADDREPAVQGARRATRPAATRGAARRLGRVLRALSQRRRDPRLARVRRHSRAPTRRIGVSV